jgi:hypothetical protein
VKGTRWSTSDSGRRAGRAGGRQDVNSAWKLGDMRCQILPTAVQSQPFTDTEPLWAIARLQAANFV